MTSTILSNNNFMPAFRFELKRIWFCFIVFPVLSVIGLVSVFGLTVSNNYYVYSGTAVQAIDITKNIAYSGGYFMIILMAIGCAIIISNIYSSFYSKRKTDFFQSLPVKRSVQYMAKSLALIAVTAASYFVAVIGVLALKPFIPAKMNLGINTVLVLKYMVVAFVSSVAIICVAQFCAVTAGKRWQYWLLLIGVTVCLPIAAVELLSIPGHLLVGASFKISNLAGIISPAFLYLLALGGVFRLRWVILFGIIISVVSFLFGWRLLAKRKSECAEQSVSSQSTVCLAVFGAMGCAASLVFALPLKQKQYIVIAVCATAAAVIAAVICSLIYNRIVVKKPIVGTAVVTSVIIFASIVVFGSGCFGYTDYIPETDEISTVKVGLGSQENAVFKGDTPFSVADVNFDEKYYEHYELKSAKSFEQIIGFQKECIKKAENSSPNNIYSQIHFVYELKDGRKFERIYKAPASATYSLNAVTEIKENKEFVKAGRDKIAAICYQDGSYASTDYSNLISLDLDRYYPALISDYMSMTQADFQQGDNDMTGISTLNFSVYYATEYASEEQIKEFSKMTVQQLDKYYQNYTDTDEKLPLKVDSVTLPITMAKVPALMKTDGYLVDSKKYSDIKTDDIKQMLVANVEYNESHQFYSFGPSQNYEFEMLYIFGCDVVKKGFTGNDYDMFDDVSDKDIISKTFSLVRDNVDQYTLFKQNNRSGYAVIFCMKDGSFSKVYYVPEVPGYQGLQ